LNISQPAISQHIHALEDYYGAKLFERSSKKVELTQAGYTLYQYAKEIMELHRLAKRAVSDLVDLVTGRLTIGASFTIGEYVLPRLLAAFSRKYPDVKFSVTIGNTEFVRERTRESGIDLGLVEGLVDDAQLINEQFLVDELILVVSKHHPLARVSSIGKQEIADQLRNDTFIMREEGSGTRSTVDKVLQNLGIEPAHVITLGSTQAIKEAVEVNLGVTMLSKWTLNKELKLGSLKPVRIKDYDVTRGFYLIQHRDKFQSKACAEFTRFLREEKLISILR